MFAEESDSAARSTQNHGDQLRELAIAEHSRGGEAANLDLFENLAGGGYGLDEDGFLVAYVGWNEVQVFEWQRQKFGEGAVVYDDAEDRAAGAMRFQAAAAEVADRLVAVSRAGHVDFPGD